MAFLKKWKNSAMQKHSKLSEEWSLATSMKDFAVHSDDIDTDSEEPDTFDVKYLGCTNIEAVRSEEATAEAVKSVILTARASRKKLPRVQLCVSPKGIEMLDASTGDALLQVSIYKISYCSADAQHSDVFAFVGTECGPGIDALDEQLTCYAFQCAKRKVAQKVTLTVAHSFEQAYRIWQETSSRRQLQAERRSAKAAKVASAASAASASASTSANSCSDGDDSRDLLIDFGASGAGSSAGSSSGNEQPDDLRALFDGQRHRDVLQNTWVSFDETDDAAELELHRPAPSVWDTTLRTPQFAQ